MMTTKKDGCTKEVPKEIKQLIQWYSRRQHEKCNCGDPSCSGLEPLAKVHEKATFRRTERASGFEEFLRAFGQEEQPVQQGQQNDQALQKVLPAPVDLTLRLWKHRPGSRIKSTSPGVAPSAERKKREKLKEYPYFFFFAHWPQTCPWGQCRGRSTIHNPWSRLVAWACSWEDNPEPESKEPAVDNKDERTSPEECECTCYAKTKRNQGTQYCSPHFKKPGKYHHAECNKGKVDSSVINVENQVLGISSSKLQQANVNVEEQCLRSVWRSQLNAIGAAIKEETDEIPEKLESDDGTSESSPSTHQTAAKTFGQGMYMYKWQKVNEQRKQRKKRKTLEQLQAVWKILCCDEEDYTMEKRSLWLLAKKPVESHTTEGACTEKTKTSVPQTRWSKSPQYADDIPGPGYYDLPPWPLRVKQNKAPFNSMTTRDSTSATCSAPPIGTYNVRLSEELGKPIPKHNTWGGPQTIKMATMIRCSEEPYDWCVVCQLQPKGDYFYSESLGPLCRSCYKVERTNQSHFNNLQMETFKPARHCGFMHFHDAHYNIFTTKKAKDIKSEVSREAYLARYQVATLAKERCLSHPERARWFVDRKRLLKTCPFLPEMPQEIVKTKWRDFGAKKSTTALGLGKPPPDWDILELNAPIKAANNFVSAMIEAMRADSDDEGKYETESESLRKPAMDEIENIKKWRVRRYGTMAKYYNAFLPDFYLPTPLEKLNPQTRNYKLAPKPRGMKSSTFIYEDPNKSTNESKPQDSCEDKMKKYLKKYKTKLMEELKKGNLISRPDLHGITIEETVDLVNALPQTNEMYTSIPNRNEAKNKFCVPCDYTKGCEGVGSQHPTN